MAIKFFTGFETGDASEIAALRTGSSIQTTVARSGPYALLQQGGTVGTSSTMLTSSLNNAILSCSFGIYVPSATPIAGGNSPLVQFSATGPTAVLTLYICANSSGVVTLGIAAAGESLVLGVSTLTLDTWHTVRVAWNGAAGGVMQAWLDNTQDINTTHVNADSNIAQVDALSPGTSRPVYFDDILIQDVVTPPSSGLRVVSRQAKAGTPTYNAFTKSNASTIDTVWADTPVNATTNASSAASGAAQTALIAAFNATQAGHGTDVIGSSDTIVAARTCFIGKRGAGGGVNVSHRRRLSGADTDTLIGALSSTSDLFYASDIFTPTLAALNSMEAGVVRATGTSQTTTVEDLWVMVAYVPFLGTAVSATKGAPYEWLLNQPSSQSALYEVLGSFAVTRQEVFELLASTSTPKAATYEGLASASTSRTSPYVSAAVLAQALAVAYEAVTTAVAVSNSKNILYEILASPVSSRVSAYENLTLALRALAFVYAASATAVQARTTDYETVKSLTTPSVESYESLAAQVQTRTARYEMLGSTTKAQSMGFELVASLLNAHVTPYEAQAIGGVSLASVIYYEAVEALITLSQSQHEVVAPALRASIKPFEIIANVNGVKSSAYDTLAAAARSLATAYESLGTSNAVSGSAQLWYEARGTVFHALAYHYESVKQLQQTGVAGTETLVGVKTPTSSSYESVQGVLHSLASAIEAAQSAQGIAEYQFSTLQSRSVATAVRYETLRQFTAQAEKTYEELAAIQAAATAGMSWDLLYVLQSVVIAAVELTQAVLVSAIDVIHQVEISSVAAVNAIDVSAVDVVPSVGVSGLGTVYAIEVSAVDVVNAVGISDVIAGVE